MSEKKKILVVDDEQDIRVYLTALFQDNGYDTITAEDGTKGLEIAKSTKPDLITLDIAMPDQSGVRIFRNFKKDPDLKQIPVIIITAVSDSLKNFLKKLSGFQDPEGFMNKPIDEEKLLKMVQDLLKK